MEILDGLNYCSRCGRRVPTEGKNDPDRSPLVVAGSVAGVGFVAYIFVLLVLSRLPIAPDVYIPVTIVYFATLLGLCFLFLRQSSLAARRNLKTGEQSEQREYMKPATTAQLEEAREFDIGSVTDHTTRTLEPNRVRER